MRAMEIIPAASLDAGKEQANRSANARSEGQSGCSLERERRRVMRERAP
jgi:hypothetical protein